AAAIAATAFFAGFRRLGLLAFSGGFGRFAFFTLAPALAAAAAAAPAAFAIVTIAIGAGGDSGHGFGVFVLGLLLVAFSGGGARIEFLLLDLDITALRLAATRRCSFRLDLVFLDAAIENDDLEIAGMHRR